MKIRQGFVSNSSSSSFIAIAHSDNFEEIHSEGEPLVIGERGKHEFGWEHEISYDFWAKLNFCVLQISYMRHLEKPSQDACRSRRSNLIQSAMEEGLDEIEASAYADDAMADDSEDLSVRWDRMLRNVLSRETGCSSITFPENVGKWDGWGYIDHQSCATEGVNIKMFTDEDTLRRFLFCRDSFIETNNDNV